MSTVSVQFDSLIKDLPQIDGMSLTEVEVKVNSEVVRLLMEDENPLHRLLSIRHLSELICDALRQQDITDVEKRLNNRINETIDNLNNTIVQKDKEFNELTSKYQQELEGIKAHEKLIKEITDSFENLKNDADIMNGFSSIEGTISGIENRLKQLVDERKNKPIAELNY